MMIRYTHVNSVNDLPLWEVTKKKLSGTGINNEHNFHKNCILMRQKYFLKKINLSIMFYSLKQNIL